MNRSAYLTTEMAIQALSWLSNANIVVHGGENIPSAPCIFVVNHFTRIETIILPHQIYNLTGVPVWSLANADLFQGGLGRYIEMVGAVSTKDPQRDELIIRTLLTGEAHWIFFPEGTMVKTKKIVYGGKYMVTDPKGVREPHTGAAVFALRTEIFKRYLERHADNGDLVHQVHKYLALSEKATMSLQSPYIVPVNLTYYPLRVRDNLAAALAAKMIKGNSILEETMIEGTMLLTNVDLDIHFGKPLAIAPMLDRKDIDSALQETNFVEFLQLPQMKAILHGLGRSLMQQYMHAIYSMTTINYDHLFATFLRLYPYSRVKKRDLLRRVYFAAMTLQESQATGYTLHRSLVNTHHHLLIDDRFAKFDNFLQLARETGVIREEGDTLVRDRSKLTPPLSFHHGRIDNPVEIIANEVEPLKRLQKTLFSLAWQPDALLRGVLARHLMRKTKKQYVKDQLTRRCGNTSLPHQGAPLLYPSAHRKVGIVLVHSYLSSPQKVKELARSLNNQGYWVYVPRLPGHGTCVEDLEGRGYGEWLDSVEAACILLDTLCRKVIIGGVGLGGSIALHVASRTEWIAGVFTVSAPFRLKDYSTQFMPAIDAWDTVLQKMTGQQMSEETLGFLSEDPNVNYDHNPVSGIREVDRLLDELEKQIENLKAPVLLLHGDEDPVVSVKSARLLFAKVGSEQKELDLIHCKRHVAVQGPDADQVRDRIISFVRSILGNRLDTN